MVFLPALASRLTALATSSEPDVANWFVVVMGVGIVFIGLVCIVVLCSCMSAIIRAVEKNKPAAAPVKTVTNAPKSNVIANRGEFIAAVSTAIAEELGTDVTAIKIVSVKPL